MTVISYDDKNQTVPTLLNAFRLLTSGLERKKNGKQISSVLNNFEQKTSQVKVTHLEVFLAFMMA